MYKLKSAKIFFVLAVLMFVAKPFLGFSLFSRSHPPAVKNIFVKAFTKRQFEDPENSNLKVEAIQKKLAGPVQQFVLRFSFLLSMIFPTAFNIADNISKRFLRKIKLSLYPAEHSYLINCKLII